MIQHVPTKPNGCFLDYTYCDSQSCQNKCGRKMTDEIKQAIKDKKFGYISYALFCDENGELIN